MVRRRIAVLVVSCAAVVAPAVWPITANAATSITVDTLDDETSSGDGCSLREAMTNVQDQAQTDPDCASGFNLDTIVFSVQGTIKLGSTLPAVSTANVTLISTPQVAISPAPDPFDYITLDGQGSSRIFVVDSAATLTLDGFRLTGGHAPDSVGDGFSLAGNGEDGGAILDGGTVNLTGVRIDHSVGGRGGSTNGTPGYGGNGGAIALSSSAATLTAHDVVFDDDASGRSGINLATGAIAGPGWGGAISNSHGTISLTNATFVYDSVGASLAADPIRGGGGIYSDGGSVAISFSTFAANDVSGDEIDTTATQPGLGVYADNGAAFTFRNTIMADTLTELRSSDCFEKSSGTVADGGYNMELNSDCEFGASVVTSVQDTDPGLDPSTTTPTVQYLGGYSATVGLRSDSVAINRIPDDVNGCQNVVVEDGRGFDRPSNGTFCDIGAYELQSPLRPQAIIFPQPPTPAPYGSTFTVNPTSTSHESVTLVASGGCTASGYSVTMTSTTTDCTLTASQPGDAIFLPATDVVQTVGAELGQVTITANDDTRTVGSGTPPSVSYSGFAPGDSASSLQGALTLTYTGIDGTTYGPSTTTPVEGGVYNVHPGGYSSDKYVISYVDGTYTIFKADQVITVKTAAPATAVAGSTFTVVAEQGRSFQSITFGSSGACTNAAPVTGTTNTTIDIESDTYTMVHGTGTCTVTLDESGNGFFNDAPEIVETVTASQGSQAIDVTTPAPATAMFDSTFTVAATGGGSGNSVVYGSSGACTNAGGITTYTMTAATGTCTVTFDQAGTDDYTAAPTVTETVTAGPANQAIDVTTPAPDFAAFGDSFTVVATGGGSGNPIVYGSSGGCSNAGGGAKYTMTSGTTTCTVTLDQAGDDDYTAAPTVTETVTAQKLPQIVSFTSSAPAGAVYGDTYTPTADGGKSGNPVVFGASGQCSYSAATGTVTMTSAGECTVTADQAGDDDYALARTQVQTFSVGAKAATLAFTGNPFWSTGSATATTAAVTLAGTVTPDPGGSVDITKATVTFLLYKSTNVSMATPDATCAGTVDALGNATCVIAALATDDWTVAMEIPTTNVYFTAPDADPAVVTVYAPTPGKFTTGGGWITDPSTLSRGHFGFSVRYKTGSQTPTGQSAYSYRGIDGYEYVVRSTSWSGGVLAVSTTAASFTGKCNVTVIDRATGAVVTTLGNYSFRVDVTDGSPNTYAISVYTSTGALFHRAGTTRSQVALGGGAVVIHGR